MVLSSNLITALERNEIGFKDWEENKDTKYALARDLMHPNSTFINRW